MPFNRKDHMKTQARDHARLIKYLGVTKTVQDWAECLGISYRTLKSRLYKLGWSEYDALTVPVKCKGALR